MINSTYQLCFKGQHIIFLQIYIQYSYVYVHTCVLSGKTELLQSEEKSRLEHLWNVEMIASIINRSWEEWNLLYCATVGCIYISSIFLKMEHNHRESTPCIEI